ncbi:terpene synthase family protein [Chitinophaga japonensis]|uniref:Terpene synthase n=1 Tax=Chitinophaga japonensis TaxID=104662 RepID=A0A562T478_CHIJA|nr:hypothetical protein [Chitinophaga japonensis]TWI88078.1 terpene synthase family protein [Chitinophaga japonensis]
MEQLRLPQIYCPFPASISRFVDEVNAHNIYWVQQFDLAPSPPLFAAYRKARFPWFVSRIYHTASYLELCIACDFCTWLFLVDDILEKTADDQAGHAQAVTEMLHVLQHNKVPLFSEYVNLAAALKDIWERLQAICPPAWQRRFIGNMKTLFDATAWEARNRSLGQLPSIAEYISMRPFTSAMYPCIDLIEMVEQTWLPDEVLQQDLVQKLVLICIEAVCWVNDLVSFEKEQRENEPHNMVLLLREEHHLSPFDAIREVTEVCNESIRHFMFLEKKLLSSAKGGQAYLQHYIMGLRSWIRGNLDWCIFDTERYGLKLARQEEGGLVFSKLFLEE